MSEFNVVKSMMRLKVVFIEIPFVFVFGYTTHCLLFAFSIFYRVLGTGTRI